MILDVKTDKAKDAFTAKEKVILQENVQTTETEEDHTVMTGEAEKDTTEEEMIDMTDTTGIFVLNQIS